MASVHSLDSFHYKTRARMFSVTSVRQLHAQNFDTQNLEDLEIDFKIILLLVASKEDKINLMF